MHRMLLFSVLSCVCLVANSYGQLVYTGESEGMRYHVDEVVFGLGVLWGVAFIGADELLVTEREGKIKKIVISSGKIVELSGVPAVWVKGQGGLLDVAVPENFSAGDWIYFTYCRDVNGQGATALARAHLRQDTIVDWEDLLITKSTSSTSRHFGGRIAFSQDGHLFFSVGDRGVRPNGQDRTTHAGTIIRLKTDGSLPADNPFVGRSGLPEIWSYGHRNPQGLFWEKTSSRLWSNEHGPRGGDEINQIQPGKNYGWPIVSHGREYWGPLRVGEATSKPGMVDPVKVYTPSIAPSSLLIYSGVAFPKWRGNFFSGALALTHLNRAVVDENGRFVKEERMLSDLDERIRDVVESREGWLYLSTDSGKIFCIAPLQH